MSEPNDSLTDEASSLPSIREISFKELSRILAAHRKWVATNREEGSRADLREVNLCKASLLMAYLQWADLQGANLQWAKLQGANLQWGELSLADLLKADLRGANLQGANLEGANLPYAELQNADLTGSDLEGTSLRRVDLRSTIGLTTEQIESAITDGTTLLPDRMQA